MRIPELNFEVKLGIKSENCFNSDAKGVMIKANNRPRSITVDMYTRITPRVLGIRCLFSQPTGTLTVEAIIKAKKRIPKTSRIMYAKKIKNITKRILAIVLKETSRVCFFEAIMIN